MAIKTWSNASGGNWNVGTNWTGGEPGNSDTADISSALSGPYTITISDSESPTLTVLNNANATLLISSTGLFGTQSLNLEAGTFSLAGRLNGTDVVDSGGSFVVSNGTLDNVTWQGPLTLSTANTTLYIKDSLTVTDVTGNFSGTISVTGNSSTLSFSNPQTINDPYYGAGGTGLVMNLGTTGTSAYLYAPSNGALTIGAGASVNEMGSYLETDGSTIDNQGTINFDYNLGTWQSYTTFIFNENLLTIGAQESGTVRYSEFSNSGSVSLSGGSTFLIASSSIANSGTMSVSQSSTLTASNSMTGGGVIQLSVDGVADVNNIVGTVDFLDAVNNDLILESPVSFTGSIQGFIKGTVGHKDTIDLRGIANSNVTGFSYTPNGTPSTGGTLAVLSSGGTLATLSLIGADYSSATFTHASDGFSSNPGTNIFTSQVSCFAAGTKILTDRGEVAVEKLRVGQRVVTVRDGVPVPRPVRWIGSTRVDVARHPRPDAVRPVRVLAGAFGGGLPHRDLVLSPDHAVFLRGVDESKQGAAADALAPIHRLVNGSTIRREKACRKVVYYHVELDSHDVLLANGLPCESYLDTGNRQMFDNAGVTTLHPVFATTAESAWAHGACARMTEDAALLAYVRDHLTAGTTVLGQKPRHEVAARLTATGTVTVALPPGRAAARLIADAFRAPGDLRELGALMRAVRLDGKPIALDGGAWESGVHEVENHDGRTVRWTSDEAVLTVAPSRRRRTLEIDVAFLAAAIEGATPRGVPASQEEPVRMAA
jgi:hypothetical protein